MCLLTKDQDEIVIRFHVFCSPDFDLEKDQTLEIVGMQDLVHPVDVWQKETAKLEVYKCTENTNHKLYGYPWMSGFFKTKKQLVLGKSVHYKYRYDGKHIEKLVESDKIYNRILHIPKDFRGEMFEQFDDFVLKNQSKRGPLRNFATGAFIHQIGNLDIEKDCFAVEEHANRIKQIIECHTKGIYFVPNHADKDSLHLYGLESNYLSLKKHTNDFKSVESSINTLVEDLLKATFESYAKAKTEENKDTKYILSIYLSSLYLLCHKMSSNISSC